jgi:hypothetical protein
MRQDPKPRLTVLMRTSSNLPQPTWPINSVVAVVWVHACVRAPADECPLQSPLIEGEWPVTLRLLLLSTKGPHFRTHKTLEENTNTAVGPDGMQNQDWLCWPKSAAIDPTCTESSHSLSFIDRCCYQEINSEDIADWEDLVFVVVICRVCRLVKVQ